jgi:PAS domain S-box-containing protein
MLAHYSSMFDDAPVGLMLLDRLGFIRDANATLYDMLEHDRIKSRMRSFNRFLTPDSREPFATHLYESWQATFPVSCELSLRTPSGRVIPIELISSVMTSQNSKDVLLHTAVINISSRRKAEDNLTKLRGDLQALLDVIPGVVWQSDPTLLRMSFVSRSAEHMLGYPPNYWYGPDFWLSCIHVDDRDRVGNLKARAVEQRKDLVLEYRMVRVDRQILWVRDAMTVRKVQGEYRLYGIAIDITDRKLAEQALQETRNELEYKVAERTGELRGTVADLEAFSYSLSHDLRAPLRAMQGYSQLLLKLFASKIGEDGREYLNRIMTSAERLDHLVQDVLGFSKVARAPLELKTIYLESLIDAIVQDNPSLQFPKAELEIRKPLLPMWGNEALLTQCLTNFLANAVKFKRSDEPPHVSVYTRPVGASVRLWVEDNGIGIAAEDQARIFGIFQRIHPPDQYEGTGIGLAIVKKAVERMGGTVGVESVLGQGSKFWLQLKKAEP